MTRRDFELIARVLKGVAEHYTADEATIELFAQRFAEEAAEENSSFNEALFRNRAGLEPKE